MFKTNSRKGLSLAAIVALAGSLLVGATPAQAAGEVTLAPNVGTTYAAISGETFTLKAVAGSTIPGSSWNTLKFRISNASNVTFSATASAAVGGTNQFVGGVTASSTVVSASSTVSGVATLALDLDFTTSDAVLSVVAWLDADGEGDLDAGEFQTDATQVSWFKASNVTWTTAITAIILGDTKLVAKVSTDKNINLAQAQAVQVGFATVSPAATYSAVSGTTVTSTGSFTVGSASVRNTAGTEATVEATHTALAANTYVAQALYGGVEVGSESLSVVGAVVASNIDVPKIAASANTKGTNIRTGTTDVTVTAVVSKSAGVAVADGTVVKVEIAEGSANSVDSKASITAGGKALTNSVSTSVQKIAFDATVTGGKVSIPVALAGLKVDNTFNVKVTNGNTTANTTFTIADTALGLFTDLSLLGTNAAIKIASGGAFSLTYGVLDNFDQPLSTDYRVTLTNGASTATVSQAVVAGKVTFAVTDAADKTEGAYTATLEKLSAATNTYVSAGTTSATTPTVGTVTAATAITLIASSASNLVLNTDAQTAADTRVGGTAPDVNTGNVAELSGQVTDANGLGTTGVVTLTAPDALFEVGGVYTLGSASVNTSATGAYAGVKIYRQLAGKVTVSATIGSVSKGLSLTYLAAAETKAANVVLTVPTAAVKSGSTYTVKAKLTDKFGNPVKVTTTGILSVKYTGPGFVTATLPSTTDAAGELQFNVLLGSSDEGTAAVTVAYDGDQSASTTTDNVTVTATVTIGVVAPEVNAAIGSFNGRWAVRVENAKGSAVSIKVGGKWFKVTSTSDSFVFSRKSRVGATPLVKVWVDGQLLNEQTITVK